ncbi:MAG: alpha/beta hydrolase fold domain-containing protein [Prevotella sp.]|nr:alpha/beta hydrolase fold domain-containing protein [Prevotella sp.]
MKKKLILLLSALFAMTTQAQTARKFTLNISDDGKAQMVCFLPENPSGRAIVGVPGGGYSVLSNSHEGYLASDWLNEQGIAYFVVNYRLPDGDRYIPIGDVQKGIRTVRDSASVWGINPYDVGVMGFSAGGHLASVVSTLSDFDARPDFSILFYPVISMDEKLSHKWSCINFLGEEGHKDPELIRQYSTQNAVRVHLTPPAVIISASDDRLVPFVTNGLEYYKAMRNAGNECAMYVYPTGDHGFGFGPWFKYHDQMLADLGNWLKNLPAYNPNAIKVACIGNSITEGFGIEMPSQYSYPAQLQQLLGKDYLVKNFGLSARTMLNKGDVPYMNEQAWKDAQAFKPDIVLIKLGTNDSKPHNWQHSAEFKQDLEQMIFTLRPSLAQSVKKSRKKGNFIENVGPKICLCTPIPAFKPTWDISDSVIVNGIIPIQRMIAKEYGLDVIDLHTLYANDGDKMLDDGIHPDGKGARRIAEIIAEAIK